MTQRTVARPKKEPIEMPAMTPADSPAGGGVSGGKGGEAGGREGGLGVRSATMSDIYEGGKYGEPLALPCGSRRCYSCATLSVCERSATTSGTRAAHSHRAGAAMANDWCPRLVELRYQIDVLDHDRAKSSAVRGPQLFAVGAIIRRKIQLAVELGRRELHIRSRQRGTITRSERQGKRGGGMRICVCVCVPARR